MIPTHKFSVIKSLIINVLTIILILATVVQSSAQGINISSCMEATYATSKLSTSTTILLPEYMGGHENGGFYQKKLDAIINDINTKQTEK